MKNKTIKLILTGILLLGSARAHGMEQPALSGLSRNVEKSNVPTLKELAIRKVAEEPSKLMEQVNLSNIDNIAKIIDSNIVALPQTLRKAVKDQLAQMNGWQVAPYISQTLEGHAAPVWCLQQLPNGMLASGSEDCTIKIWNLEVEQCVHTLTGHAGTVSCLKLLPSGMLVSGSRDGTIKIWNLDTKRCTQTLAAHTYAIARLELLPNGMLASGSVNGTMKIWNPDAEEQCVHTLTGHTGTVSCLKLLPNGMLALGSYADGSIKIWNLDTKRCVQTLRGHKAFASATCLELLPNGMLASGSAIDGIIKIWNPDAEEQCAQTLEGYTYSLSYPNRLFYSLQQLPNGMLASSGAEDRNIKIWNLKTGECLPTLTIDHTDSILCLKLLNGMLVSGSDGTIEIWNPGSYEYVLYMLALQKSMGKVEQLEALCMSLILAQLNEKEYAIAFKRIRDWLTPAAEMAAEMPAPEVPPRPWG